MVNKEILELLNFVLGRKAIEYVGNKKNFSEFKKDVFETTSALLKNIHKIEVESPLDLFDSARSRNAYKLLLIAVYKELEKNRK